MPKPIFITRCHWVY